MVTETSTKFSVRLATTAAEMREAQRLRYDVFVTELGGGGAMVDHIARLEEDKYDPFVDHLLLVDNAKDCIVGVYRLLRQEQARAAGGFYSAGEFDLTPLTGCGQRLLELGRSCLHRDYRGGSGMHVLWAGVARYVAAFEIDILFGVASFHGTDAKAVRAPLSLLYHRHLAPTEFRVTSRDMTFADMDLIDLEKLDSQAAMRQVPSLIKAYLRQGAWVGEGAFVDRAFNTTDVCLILDTKRLSSRHARLYAGRT